jgi:alanyl-tRNA synthetase
MADNENDDLDLSDAEAEQLLNADDDSDQDSNNKATEQEPSDAEQLGDAGKKALDRMKADKRAAERRAADLEKRLKQHEDKGKSELQRLIEERDTLKGELGKVSSAAKRRDIAEEFAPDHATHKQIRLVAKYLAGADDEELQASAAELFAQFAPEKQAPKTPSRPKERLKGGAEPEDEPEETDGRKIAAKIPRSTLLNI